ncbi:PTS sugar transporter subunit IIA [Lactococcus termiticola]|uniref:Glucose specific PTS system IIA component n=1 Tax=Lactococcus termiticola TaxID=2169526 RepID=A0A2R5HDX7_9LACT|nr:glucose PTS transporter subunit IIA [Lactococcus termiticola]GBG96026.1 glucose specific PTS system IIA component [Lactococcus termiticola]
MFGRRKKQQIELIDDPKIYAPLDGEVLDLSVVPDPIFAQKKMGDGFAIKPTGNKIYSPVAGSVIMKEGHAVAFRRLDGLEVLLHFGLDTVGLTPSPVRLKVAVGDVVEPGQEIGKADWLRVEAKGLSIMTMVILTNSSEKLEKLEIDYREAQATELLGEAIAK